MRGRAPTERRIAISRRRSFKVERIMVSMPSSAVATTMAEITFSAVSAVPTRPHSSCNAAPGRIAVSGSARYSLMARCNRNAASRDLRPTRAAVMALGVRSSLRTSSAEADWPGTRPPLCQSTWIASMASRLTCTVRSTGVPVRSRMPATRNGLSSCSTNETEPSPCATTIGSPTL